MRSTMELAVDDDPGVVTGMSDKTSPDYINLFLSAKRGPGRAAASGGGQVLFGRDREAVGVANLDRAEVELLQCRLNRLPVADRHHDHVGRHDVLLRNCLRLS